MSSITPKEAEQNIETANTTGYETYEQPQQDQEQQDQEQEQSKTASSFQEYIKGLDDEYFREVKENAKLKAFTVIFDGGDKKIYTRRKVTMKEIAEIERKREILRAGQGSALQKANALLDFYWYSAQCHLRETKSGKPMTKSDYERVTFEDFKKIIDACEFIMLYGVPKN